MPTHLAPPLAKSRFGFKGCVILAFSLCWWFVTLVGDFMVLRGAIRQVRTLDYVAVEGTMTKCQVTEEPSDEGTSYGVRAEYTYRIGDQPYVANRVRHLEMWGRSTAIGFVGGHPPGSSVTVYYDPADPADAVLIPGVGGPELFYLMFLAPFNLIMFGLAFGVGQALVFGDPPVPEWPRGVQFFKRHDEARVRVIKTTPATAAAAVFAGGTFFGTFAVAFAAGMPPAAVVMIVAWLAILGATAFAYWRRICRIAARKDDLVIDGRRKRLTLPQTFGRTGPVVVSVADVLAVEVDVVTTNDEHGHLVRYAPTVRWRDAASEPREGRLAEWEHREHAERLVEWIRSRTRLAPRAGSTPPLPANK
jgi:Protein of unknown function (DUF3592)